MTSNKFPKVEFSLAGCLKILKGVWRARFIATLFSFSVDFVATPRPRRAVAVLAALVLFAFYRFGLWLIAKARGGAKWPLLAFLLIAVCSLWGGIKQLGPASHSPVFGTSLILFSIVELALSGTALYRGGRCEKE